MSVYTISQIAREFDITPRAIRFYEDKGLLSPERRGQARIYNAKDRARIILIMRGKRFGFSLRDIKEMLDLYDRPDGGVQQLHVTKAKAQERIAAMEEQIAELQQSIGELRSSISDIDARLASEAGEAPQQIAAE